MTDDTLQTLRARFAVSPLVDTEIDVGAMGWAALTPEADHEVRLSVTAAVIAEFMGYKSIDRVRKKLVKDARVHEPRDAGLREICARFLALYDAFYRTFRPRENERMGVFAFDLAMIRSRASIELMLVTARQGFLIEPCLIARSLVEQFAYAWRVWPSDEDEIIFQTKPQSVIAGLKSIHPAVGRAYGLLSALAHYDPTMHHSFIGEVEQYSEGESSTVTQRSWKFKITSSAWVFFILDLKYRIFKACYGKYPNFSILSPCDGSVLEEYDKFFQGVDLHSLRQVRGLIAG